MGVAEISDLSHERSGEQHILCRQVPVDDLRSVFVQVEKAPGYVLQNGSLQR